MNLLESLIDFSCKRFARHVATGVEPLGGGHYARFQFWIHWAICPFCRRYWKELNAIGEIQRKHSDLRNHSAVRMSDVKQRLKEKLTGRAS
jgi:hypothetical protein